MADDAIEMSSVRAVINARIDAEIARAKSYKAAGPALAGHGAGYCDYAAKVLLEVRAELLESERCSPVFKASECAPAPAQMIATREPAITGEQHPLDGAMPERV